MQQLANVTLRDDYHATTTLGPSDGARALSLQVYNSAATLQLFKPPQGAPHMRGPIQMDEITVPPGSVVFPGVIGLKAKNANPRARAVVYAQLYERADPIPSGFSPTNAIASTDAATGLPVVVNNPAIVFGPVLSQQVGFALPNPGDNQLLGPFDMRGYRSVILDTIIAGAAGVTLDVVLTWEMSDNPGVARTTDSFQLTVGDEFTVERNQGDVLHSVLFTAPTGGVTLSSNILGSNYDPLALGGGQVEYAGYAVFSDNAGQMLQYVPYSMGDFATPGDNWSLEKGVPLLDLTTLGGPSVLKDGIYTWTLHPRFVVGAFAPGPNPYPPPNAWKAYTANFELQISTIPGILFLDCSIPLPLARYEGADGVPQPIAIYPQTTTATRIMMRAGDRFYKPFVVHNIPDADPYAVSRIGADMEIQLLWEPLAPPFPFI